MKTIWVIGGGPSTEFEISLKSAITVSRHLSYSNAQVRPVMISREGRWLLSRRYINKQNPNTDWLEQFYTPTSKPAVPYSNLNLSQMLLNLVDDETICACLLPLHGQFGEDGCVQGLFETAGIAYTGSGVGASSMAFHKARAKDILRAAGLSVANHISIGKNYPLTTNISDFPVIVKPSCGGSSVGITLVETSEQLPGAVQTALSVDTEAMIEQFIPGIEVSCSVIDKIIDGSPKTIALPATLIKPNTSLFFDYKAKYEVGASTEQTPAPLPKAIIDHIQQAAMSAHIALGCEGVSRTDMIITKQNPTSPVILEVNTLPGMTETSLLPQQATAVGISLSQLINNFIDYAIWRNNKKRAMR